MPTSEWFAIRCLEWADFDLACPIPVILERYQQQRESQPDDNKFKYGKLESIHDFIYMLCNAPQPVWSKAELLAHTVGDVLPFVLQYGLARMRDTEIGWFKAADAEALALRAILASTESRDPVWLRQHIEMLKLRKETG